MSDRGLQPVEHSAKLGGGRSARLIALAVVVVLAGFIAIGVMGRAPAPVPPPVAEAQWTPLPSLARPSPKPLPEPRPTATPFGAVERITARTPAPNVLDDRLAAVLQVAGTGHWARFEQTGPDEWVASYRIPYPRPALEGALVLTQLSRPGGPDRLSLGRWDVSFEAMTLGWDRARVELDVTQPALYDDGGDGLGSTGYRLTVLSSSVLYNGVLSVLVERAPTTERHESYAVDARVGDLASRVPLLKLSSGHFAGMLTIPDHITDESLDFAVVVMPNDNPMLGMVTVYEGDIAMPHHGRFNTGEGISLALDALAPEPNMPKVLTHRSEFQAQTRYSGFQRVVVFDLRVHFNSMPTNDIASPSDDGFADMSIPWPPRDYPGPSLGD